MPTKPVCHRLQKKVFGVYKSPAMINTSMFTFLVFSGLMLSIILSLTEDDMHNAFATTTTTSTPDSTIPLHGDARPAPKYSANSLDGKISSLEDFRGNPVLINVWATWCIPCREEMPALEALYNEFSDKGLQVIGVSVDSHGSESRVKSFINRMGITYTIWHDPNDKFTRAFRTIGVPESFLINPQGQIVHVWKGPFDAMSQDTKARVVNVLSTATESSSGITNSGDNISSQTDTALNTNNNTRSVSPITSTTTPKNDASGSSNASSQASSDQSSIKTSQLSSPPNSKQQGLTTINTQQQSNYQTIGYPVAFVAGILSFLSPCILPLIPGYVAFITGMSMEDLTSNKNKNKKKANKNADLGPRRSYDSYDADNLMSPQQSSSKLPENYAYTSSKQNPSPNTQYSTRHTAIIRGLLFIGGFSVVFVALGASITAIGAAFSDYGVWIERIGGVMLVIFGLHLLGILRIPGSEREWGFRFSKRPVAGHIGSFIIGMGFGAGWTPCIGPILASILTIAASSTSLTTGITLLSVYSAGLAIPFILSTVAVERFIIAFKKFRRWLPWVNRTSAALLIGVGIMLLTGMLTLITGTLSGLGMPMNLG